MAVVTYNDELVSPLPPKRFFKALFKDCDNLIPKLMPQGTLSMELLEGDGGAGSIRKITFNEGNKVATMKTRVDELNEETLTYKYTLIEGNDLMGKFEKIAYEIQFTTSEIGGTISKMTTHGYSTGDDVAVKEEDIIAGKEKGDGMFKVVEAYLLANPEAYV